MKLFQHSPFTRSVCLIVLTFFSAGVFLAAQDQNDPSASQIPNHDLQIPDEKAPPQYNTTSTVLLISGLIGTIGGAVLCVYSVQFKAGYNTAYANWLASPTAGNLSARDAAGVQYLAPFISGIALGVSGILLTIAGISTGMGGESYQPIIPKINKEAPVSSGLYFFVSPNSLGIAIR